MIATIETLRRYERRTFKGDLVAGITTAIMLVPQGMAYAMLAGLDPIVGLYASTIPVALYAFFGTSSALAVGPVALDSMLVAAAVAPIAAREPSQVLTAASLLALMVGAIQFLMGAARLGALARWVKRPVLSGFTTAAALLIAASQLGSLLGVTLPRSSHLHVLLGALVWALPGTHAITVVVGAVAIMALLAMKRWTPRLPRFLVVVAVAVAVSWGVGLPFVGVDVVGAVPAGLPTLALPSVPTGLVLSLIPAALSIAVIGTVEVVAIGSHFARVRDEDLNVTRELLAIGVANIGSGLFQGYPVAGGFSRSAVHAQAGSRTPLAGLVTAVLIALVLLVLTPVFGPLPKAVLAAIIVTAIAGLVDIGYARELWRADRPRVLVWATTLIATLALGMLWGLGLGLVSSLLVHLKWPRSGRLDAQATE